MTKENLIKLSNDTFTSNNARQITADNHRYFNEQLIDSMATCEQGRIAETALQGATFNGSKVHVSENILDITLDNTDCSVWCSAITSSNSGLMSGMDNLRWRINGDALELSGRIGTSSYTDNYFKITNIPTHYAKRVMPTEVMVWATFPNSTTIVLVNVYSTDGSVTIGRETLSNLSSIQLNAVVPLAPFSVSEGDMGLIRYFNLSRLTYGGGLFVALGNSSLFGGINYAFSTDGKNWTADSFSTKDGEIIITNVAVYGVAYGNGRFVGVGGPNYCVFSENGENWETVKTGLDVILRDVVYVNGQFIAVGDSCSCFISRNGVEWEKVEVEVEEETSKNFVAITYGNDIYFLVTSSGEYFYTSDFQNWVYGKSGFIVTDGVYYSGKFYIVGESGAYICVVPGEEGYTFGYMGWSSGLGAITCGDGIFVALNDIGYTFSNNGKIWSVEQASYHMSDIVYADNKFVAVGGHRYMTFER